MHRRASQHARPALRRRGHHGVTPGRRALSLPGLGRHGHADPDRRGRAPGPACDPLRRGRVGPPDRVGRLRRRPVPIGLRRRSGHVRQSQRRPRRPGTRLRRQPPDQPGPRRGRLPGQRHRGPRRRRVVGAEVRGRRRRRRVRPGRHRQGPERRRRRRVRPGPGRPVLLPVLQSGVAQQRRHRSGTRAAPQRPSIRDGPEDVRDHRVRVVAVVLRRRRRASSAAPRRSSRCRGRHPPGLRHRSRLVLARLGSIMGDAADRDRSPLRGQPGPGSGRAGDRRRSGDLHRQGRVHRMLRQQPGRHRVHRQRQRHHRGEVRPGAERRRQPAASGARAVSRGPRVVHGHARAAARHRGVQLGAPRHPRRAGDPRSEVGH